MIEEDAYRTNDGGEMIPILIHPNGSFWTKLSAVMMELDHLKTNVDNENHPDWKHLHVMGRYELNVP